MVKKAVKTKASTRKPSRKWMYWGTGQSRTKLEKPGNTTRFRLAQKGTRFHAPLIDDQGDPCVFDDRHPVHDIPNEVASIFHKDARTHMRLVVVRDKSDEVFPAQPRPDMGQGDPDAVAALGPVAGPPAADQGTYRAQMKRMSRKKLDEMVRERDGDPETLANKAECITFILSTPDPDPLDVEDEEDEKEEEEDGEDEEDGVIDPNE